MLGLFDISMPSLCGEGIRSLTASKTRSSRSPTTILSSTRYGHVRFPTTRPVCLPYLGSDDTPYNSRQIRDLGKNKTQTTRRRYTVIAKGFEAQEQTLASHTVRIASLEEDVAQLKRGKKRKAIPNPNRSFMTLSEVLASGKSIPEVGSKKKPCCGGC